MPDELAIHRQVLASSTSFDLNEFLRSRRHGHERTVQAQRRRAEVVGISSEVLTPRRPSIALRTGTRPPFPYSDVRLLPLPPTLVLVPCPNVRGLPCHGQPVLAEKHNTFLARLQVVVAAGASAGIGLSALPPVRKAIGSGFETKNRSPSRVAS